MHSADTVGVWRIILVIHLVLNYSVGPPLRKQKVTGRVHILTLTQLEGCFLSPSPSSRVSKLLSGFKTYTAGGFTPPLAPPPRPLAPLPPASPATPTQMHHSHCTHPVSSARSTEPMVSFPGIALADRGRPLHLTCRFFEVVTCTGRLVSRGPPALSLWRESVFLAPPARSRRVLFLMWGFLNGGPTL